MSAVFFAVAAAAFAGALAAEPACDAAPGEALLQTRSRRERRPPTALPESLAQVTSGNPASFGPDGCVELSVTKDGTCQISTHCSGKDISDTEFALVCINPNNEQPYALHTYGKGGFGDEEAFDTGIQCERCATTSSAFSRHEDAPSPPPPAPTTTTAPPAPTTTTAPERETAYFGPAGCFVTYLSKAGTCMVRSKCNGKDLSKFNPGITCTDKAGGYTRYYLGLNTFKEEETFDTTLKCQACVGVGDDPGKQVSGLLPKGMLEDFGSLEKEVYDLKKEMDGTKKSSERIDDSLKAFEAELREREDEVEGERKDSSETESGASGGEAAKEGGSGSTSSHSNESGSTKASGSDNASSGAGLFLAGGSLQSTLKQLLEALSKK